jgi:outer membrane protein assembly factor BamB
MMHSWGIGALLPVLFAGGLAAPASGWLQWGQNGEHTGNAGVVGQPTQAVVAAVVSDPFTAAERADPLGLGELLIHYQTPLLSGNDVFIEVKGGRYSDALHWQTQVWAERRLTWRRGVLSPEWQVTSDWRPVPYGLLGRGPTFQPVFHAAIAGDSIYLPALGGSVLKIDRRSGAVRERISPFGAALDPTIYVVGPLASDGRNIVYDAIKLAPTGPWTNDVVDSWLVRIDGGGRARAVSFRSLAVGAPGGSDPCLGSFSPDDLPWPPSPDARPPDTPCGSQRPALNAAPAIAPDGTIYVPSVAHLNSWTGYLLAVNADLSPRWQRSLRDLFTDGCNVLVPANGSVGGCRTGARTGVDPAQNRPGAARILDDSTASPVLTPDGRILFGTFTRYNRSQGHLVAFNTAGTVLASYPFGWDLTPALDLHDATYSVLIKENHYGVGSYCDNSDVCPPQRGLDDPAGPEAYFVTRLAATLEPEWRFQNTNTQSCVRTPLGLHCLDDHPASFEWCVNAVAVDAAGVTYAASEDGGLYAIDRGGNLLHHLFLDLAVGAAYTPIALDAAGRVFTQNDGIVFALGRARPGPPPAPR